MLLADIRSSLAASRSKLLVLRQIAIEESAQELYKLFAEDPGHPESNLEHVLNLDESKRASHFKGQKQGEARFEILLADAVKY